MSRAQWAVAALLAVGFAVAAVVVAGGGSGGDDGPAAFDEVAWCRAASAMSERAAMFEPGFDGDGSTAVVNLLVEVDTALPLAALELRPHLARVNDVVVLVSENLSPTASVQEALAASLVFTDGPRLEEAVAAVSAAMVSCGHAPLPAALAGASG